ncbi:MAG: helix-turn-helix domain-containing protein [Maricaulaceae bacterium]
MGRQKQNGMLRLDETEAILKSSFRTMALFEYFADIQTKATIGDISANLNIPQSSASALVKSLVDSGYLAKVDGSRYYYPTMRLSMLADWMDRDSQIIPQLVGQMRQLANRFDQPIVLALRNGIYSQYIMVETTEPTVRQHVETGSLRPLVCSSSGWAMLSRDNDDDIGKLIRRTQAETDNNYWKDTANTALHHIALTRRNGFAFSEGPDAKGTAGIAVPLPTTTPSYSLALAAAGTTTAMQAKKDDIAVAMLNIVKNIPLSSSEKICGHIFPNS